MSQIFRGNCLKILSGIDAWLGLSNRVRSVLQYLDSVDVGLKFSGAVACVLVFPFNMIIVSYMARYVDYVSFGFHTIRCSCVKQPYTPVFRNTPGLCFLQETNNVEEETMALAPFQEITLKTNEVNRMEHYNIAIPSQHHRACVLLNDLDFSTTLTRRATGNY